MFYTVRRVKKEKKSVFYIRKVATKSITENIEKQKNGRNPKSTLNKDHKWKYDVVYAKCHTRVVWTRFVAHTACSMPDEYGKNEIKRTSVEYYVHRDALDIYGEVSDDL